MQSRTSVLRMLALVLLVTCALGRAQTAASGRLQNLAQTITLDWAKLHPIMATSLGLTGEEVYDLEGLPALLDSGFADSREIIVRAGDKTFRALVRIDTPQEIRYYQHGGILQYVLRQLLGR